MLFEKIGFESSEEYIKPTHFTDFKEKFELSCPCCKHKLNGMEVASEIENDTARPEEGSVVICFKCNALLIFHIKDSKSYLAEPTKEEFEEIQQDKELFDLIKNTSNLLNLAKNKNA
ncbi:MAG: hypothetical protein EKK64_04290 [Neisseriaceae bacterium]|nr:MAG: hypothetical protein EKK64_04290 [Neisseriaceae bacterium]